jgi:hypothetical protein
VGNWLEKNAADGKLAYLDKKRAATLEGMSGNQLSRVLRARLQFELPTLFRRAGLQLPGKPANVGSNLKILTDKGPVKRTG